MEQFFHLSNSSYSTTIMPRMEISQKWQLLKEPIKNYSCPAFLEHDIWEGIYPSWLSFPVVFHQNGGERIRDVLGDGMRVVLISDRMVNILIEEQLTGWKTYKILFYDNRGETITGFNGFSVIGRGGTYVFSPDCPKDWMQCEIKYANKEHRTYDIRQWDGSDFFTISGSLFSTKRAVDALKKHKISSLLYQPIEELFTLIG